jgi:DNA-3-methyladenine glycosylase I
MSNASDTGVLTRCDWAANVPPLYQEYHDIEWGRPLRGDRELFERIVLEAFQAGLSWWSVLQRREAFREAFADFDPEQLAAWGDSEIEQALQNPQIIRNRAKVRSVVTNAKVAITLPEGELTDLVWSFAPPKAPAPQRVTDLHAITPESEAMAKALKGRGFVFLGPTTCYALMQACGLVNDHIESCSFRYSP